MSARGRGETRAAAQQKKRGFHSEFYTSEHNTGSIVSVLTNDSNEFVAKPGGLGGEQGERGDRVLQVHVDGVDVDAAALAHARNGFPAGEERTRYLVT